MKPCPNCGAHREDDEDFCPVCGETFPGPTISERTSPRWYRRTGFMLVAVLLAWPVALYGLYKRDAWDANADQWMLAGCLVLAAVWSALLQMI